VKRQSFPSGANLFSFQLFFPPALWNPESVFRLRAIRINTPMANEHPFQLLFETLGRVPGAHADSVNRKAYESLRDILTVPIDRMGRCILLRAPRAGHGKTHLLSRIQHQLGATHEFIPLQAASGFRIDAGTVMDDTVRRLVRPLPAAGGLCMLDLVTRRLFASALQPLVGSGEVPCQDREGALMALRTRPIETFDFHHPNAVTAHWARENFDALGQRLSMELSHHCGLPVREIAFWVDALFRFAASPLDNANRVRLLGEAVHSGGDVAMERLEALLGLLSLMLRVVLVADDLEGFSTDETAALRLAAFLTTLRQSVERVEVILSLNQDVWENAFLPKLSGGLADRLSEIVVELQPLSEDEMVALLDSRAPGLGRRVLERVDPGSAGTYARGLIRAAGAAWVKASEAAATPPTGVAVSENPRDSKAEVSGARQGAELPATAVAQTNPEPSSHQPPVEPSPVASPAAPLRENAALVAPESVPAAAPYYPPVQETPPQRALEAKPDPQDVVPQDQPAEAPPVAEEVLDLPSDRPTTSKLDRVDDLLRQFRERYGRGSL
jgi:hypothetical protein